MKKNIIRGSAVIKKIALRGETIARLSSDQLAGVHGGDTTVTITSFASCHAGNLCSSPCQTL